MIEEETIDTHTTLQKPMGKTESGMSAGAMSDQGRESPSKVH